MSLFMPQSEMWDLPLPGERGQRHIPHWFGNLAFAVVGFLCKLLWRYRVDGRENLRAFKDVSGVLVVCNHTSFLDVVFMYLSARPSQWIRLMGRDSLFDNAGGLLGQALSRVGAFPVKRDSADRGAIKRATSMLKSGELVGILPEGTRRGRGTAEMKLHSGAAFIARMGKAPILPMTVRNAELVKQKGKWLRFPKITVEFGQPLLVGDFDFFPKEERLDACTWYAMRECFALSQRIPAEEVDMAALFPSAKDYSAAFAEHPVERHSSAEVAAALAKAKQEKQ
ncbi:lysophospholipid acyltransferase family protein [Parvibacter caecicola]|uniref:1-acyl-sn-glycerol-3-phosphate acyltransferase n=1 Tax=Parvibacter caecicola TaxID=747645 RepID=A0A7W5D0P1_9ACTN|nr:lysophospholipid acyltransferase family protein [Parvibacter caecicola]MBB3170593.1 1-acyl-sn-glycerol-3-phosphate acyltransferase [Parvibacter caecicola]MCR2041446.1 1-acyl-sn-glycerol-3-phosphate acyltransferase [Parvibacter caecicola]RNL12028.1 1-acyl-sn-glycerol-3-phosphate acyltransferase [Parvibacter caecicola]